MSYTQEDLAMLKSMLTTGELSVQHNGRRIQYRSIAELERAIAVVEGELHPRKGRFHRAIFDKGL